MAEQRELSGILSKNDKQKDTHPDYRGSCLIDGTSYKISSWIKTRADGSKFMSLAFNQGRRAVRHAVKANGHCAL